MDKFKPKFSKHESYTHTQTETHTYTHTTRNISNIKEGESTLK